MDYNNKLREKLRAIIEIGLRNDEVPKKIFSEVLQNQKQIDDSNNECVMSLGQGVSLSFNKRFNNELCCVLRLVDNSIYSPVSGSEFVKYSIIKIIETILAGKIDFEINERYDFVIKDELNIIMKCKEKGKVIIELKDEEEF